MPVQRSISSTTPVITKPSSGCSGIAISRPRSTSTAGWRQPRRMRCLARSSVNTSSSTMRPEDLPMWAAPRIETTKAKVRSLPIELWPESDRKAWISASRPSHRLNRGGAGSHMKAITLDDLARRYGYFLDYMNRCGLLDPTMSAGAHVVPENVDTYLKELVTRVGSVTVQGSIYKLRRACELINPARDVFLLADVQKNLALVMRPRSKSNRWVLTEVLIEAALTLIAEAENSRKMSNLGQARQVRNGLMVAMLALHPIRLKNFADLEIGRNFVEIKGSWWIVLSASETKEGRPDERRIDDLLQPALDRYLKNYRPILAEADQSTQALWVPSNAGAPTNPAGGQPERAATTRPPT